MKKQIYNSISLKKGRNEKMLAILIDPDKASESYIESICNQGTKAQADLIFIGGSLMTNGDINQTVLSVKKYCTIPTVIFPGSALQITDEADGILFLSLLSSRNPEMLIGQQVIAAPYLKKTSLEIISTAYLLIESGVQTTASYMSNSNPIPADKSEIAASTALAGEFMGMELIYLDGGSGAKNPVPFEMIQQVKKNTSRPIIVGGGLDSINKVKLAYEAGADIVVIGNALEKNPNFLLEASALR